jgi:hypothetical protein
MFCPYGHFVSGRFVWAPSYQLIHTCILILKYTHCKKQWVGGGSNGFLGMTERTKRDFKKVEVAKQTKRGRIN